jgi:membrane protease YdiL (CAAX protease family)
MTEILQATTVRLHAAEALLALIVVSGLALDIRMLAALVRRRKDASHAPWLLPESGWSLPEASLPLLAMLTAFVSTALAVALARRMSLLPPDSLAHIALVLRTLLVPSVGLVVIARLLRRRNQSWRSAFGLPTQAATFRSLVSCGAAAYLAAMPLILSGMIAARALLRRFGHELAPQEALQILFDPQQPLWLQVYLVVIAVAGAPLFEETVFRGLLLPALARPFGFPAAAALASLVFAALHSHAPSLLPLWILGVSFSLGYACSGSLLVPVTTHILFNGVNLMLQALSRPGGS